MEQQSNNTLQEGAQSSSTQMQQQAVDSLLTNLQPQLELMLTIGTLLSVAFMLVVLINVIHKWRVARAILRMDKNLQTLVDTNKPAPAPVVTDNTES